MSTRNVAGGHTLPPNPEFLDFERTDGDAKQWPTNTKEVVDADGNVNYMKPIGPDDGQSIHWRCQIAMKIAERLGRPCTWAHSLFVASTPRPVLIVTSAGRNYVLRSWPEGYHLYCHYKGKQSSARQDLYLLGTPFALLPLLFRRNYTQRLLVAFRIGSHETVPLSSRVCASRNMAYDGSYAGSQKLRMQVLCQGSTAIHLRKSWF